MNKPELKIASYSTDDIAKVDEWHNTFDKGTIRATQTQHVLIPIHSDSGAITAYKYSHFISVFYEPKNTTGNQQDKKYVPNYGDENQPRDKLVSNDDKPQNSFVGVNTQKQIGDDL